MSRIGNQSIEIPEGVTVTLASETLTVKGAKGTLSVDIPKALKLVTENKMVKISTTDESKDVKSLHGLVRSLVQNAVVGVTKGWEKNLELVGVGYRAAGGGKEITLSVGFSHPVKISAPSDISFTIKDNTKLTVSGTDKKKVGEIAAMIRRVKPPEPYKGKGIRYAGEVIRKKAGKAVKAAASA